MTRFIHINYFASTNNQSKQFSDELDTIDSSQVDSFNGNEVYLIPETYCSSLIQKGAINLKSLERKFYLKIEELEQIIKPQNENHKDLETQYQNESKFQIKEF